MIFRIRKSNHSVTLSLSHPATSQSGFLPIWLIMLLAISFVAGGIVVLPKSSKIDSVQNTLSTSPSISPLLTEERQGEVSDTSDWQTYRNEEYGFEVKYPPDWRTQELTAELQKAAKISIGGGEFGVEFCRDVCTSDLPHMPWHFKGIDIFADSISNTNNYFGISGAN